MTPTAGRSPCDGFTGPDTIDCIAPAAGLGSATGTEACAGEAGRRGLAAAVEAGGRATDGCTTATLQTALLKAWPCARRPKRLEQVRIGWCDAARRGCAARR